jgi:hypothetical protein
MRHLMICEVRTEFSGFKGTYTDPILVTAEEPIVGSLTFHQLGLYISAGCTGIAVAVSLFLIWMHAMHYTKPYEQKQ